MNLPLVTGCLSLVLLSTSMTPSTTSPTTVSETILNLWPDGKMPGHGATQPEGEKPPTGDGVQRITNVSQPTLTVFKAPPTPKPGPAMVVCPGGGYNILAYNKEGTEIAAWLNSLGITALVLKYRVPDNREGAFQDVHRAMRIARLHALDWNIDIDHLGIIGFSAGGHLAARLSTNYDQPTYREIDRADKLSPRPDFVILVYPAYLEVKSQLAPELHITPNIPPTLLIHAEDDLPYFPSSQVYHAALDAGKIPNEFLVYPTGGHGFGLHSPYAARVWPQQAAAWLRMIGTLSRD
jgi:acetyl esterase/lipase